MGQEIKKVDLDQTYRLGAPKEDKVRVFRNKKKLKGKLFSIKNLTKMEMEALIMFEPTTQPRSRRSRYFVYLSFWFVLGFLGLSAYATAFHM